MICCRCETSFNSVRKIYACMSKMNPNNNDDDREKENNHTSSVSQRKKHKQYVQTFEVCKTYNWNDELITKIVNTGNRISIQHKLSNNPCCSSPLIGDDAVGSLIDTCFFFVGGSSKNNHTTIRAIILHVAKNKPTEFNESISIIIPNNGKDQATFAKRTLNPGPDAIPIIRVQLNTDDVCVI